MASGRCIRSGTTRCLHPKQTQTPQKIPDRIGSQARAAEETRLVPTSTLRLGFVAQARCLCYARARHFPARVPRRVARYGLSEAVSLSPSFLPRTAVALRGAGSLFQ